MAAGPYPLGKKESAEIFSDGKNSVTNRLQLETRLGIFPILLFRAG